MDAPFALRGYLASTGSKHQMMDGFHRSSLPERLGGYKTVTTASSSFLPRTSQPSLAPHGSRTLHGTQVLKGASTNRPLSPHIALKKPQLNATYSISHRIFGGVVAGAILIIPVAMKFGIVYSV